MKELKEKKLTINGILFKRKAVIAGIVLLVSISLISILIYTFTSKQTSSYQIVSAKKGIEKGCLITDEMLLVSQTNDYNIAKNSVADKDNVIGKYAKVDITDNATIYKNQISDTEIYPDKYSHLPQNWNAISLTFDSFAASLSGKLRPGDIVTVYTTPKESDNTDIEVIKQKAEILPELTYVEVIAVTADSSADIVRTDDSVALENTAATITLLLSNEQAKTIVNLEEKAYVHFGLACRNNENRAKELLKVQSDFFDKNEEE